MAPDRKSLDLDCGIAPARILPWLEDELALIEGQVAVSKKMMICVTYDHRILNGTEVSEFESYLKKLLENPI